MPARRHAPLAAAAALLMVALLWSARASAFCRTTTCLDCAAPASGCVTDGLPLYWKVGCISYDVQQSGSKWATYDQTRAIAATAFQSWTGSTCADSGVSPTFQIKDLGAVACDQQEYNDQSKSFGGNANIILFHDDDWTLTSTTDPASTLALTTVTFAVDSGEIYDADIEINGTKQISIATSVDAGSYDLQSILTHEIGHFLGLAHSTETCSLTAGDCPTMNAYYLPGSDSDRTLEADDVAGLCAIYPASHASDSNSCTPRHGFASACGSLTPPPSSGCSVAPAAGGDGRGRAAPALGLLLLGWGFARARRRAVAEASSRIELPTPGASE